MWVDINISDLLPYLPLAFGIPGLGLGGGYQKSQSDSSEVAESGLNAGNRQNLAQMFFRAVQPGYQGMKPEEQFGNILERRVTGPQPTLPGLSKFGLYQPQQAAWDQGFGQAVTQALSRLSGNFANRGFLNPENINAIAGSAAQNVAPQFAAMAIPTAGQNIVSGVTIPEDIFANRASTLRDFQALLAQLITGGSTSAGTGHSTSFGVQAEASFGKKP